ncbi:MAG: carbonic anhydrase [Chitinophagia bacterium]|nr:carbonic anhydrase [Chitinophagia bacterium]
MKTYKLGFETLTPGKALTLLKHGNFRFINNIGVNRDLLQLMQETRDEQRPFAAIFSCMDSRTSAELIFDQGFGDIFSIRIAGNVLSHNVLGSLEYALVAAGAKLIVVLGHTGCGAIKGACDDVKLGHLTSLLNEIKPAVLMEKTIHENRNGDNNQFVNAVATIHVKNTAQEIMEHSAPIREMVMDGKAGIIPALYDIGTGKVTFFDDCAMLPNIVDQPLKENTAVNT